MSDTWPNGVPYIDEDTRKENLNDPTTLRDLIATLWLYLNADYAERQLTTEQKELFADVLEMNAAAAGETHTHDRWWQR